MTVNSLRYSRFFCTAVCFALWVMLFPAILPLLHNPAALASQGTQPICHMAMAGDNQPTTPDQGKVKPACPICQSLAGLAQGYVPPAPIVLAVLLPVTEAPIAVDAVIPVFETPTTSWPRAPPFFV